MKKTLLFILLALALCLGTSAAENIGLPGQSSPDITVTDTRGNTFTLEEIMNDTSTCIFPMSAVTWGNTESAPAEDTAPQAYILHFIDQHGSPVPGVYANFCTDTACVLQQSDENGTIIFDGAPDVYHVQLLKTPEGFSFDPGFEMYTDAVYGEWVLCILKLSAGGSVS